MGDTLDRQTNFEDLQAFYKVKNFNETQIRIVKLLIQGSFSQALIAQELGLSRQYVNRFTKLLEKHHLIKKGNSGSWVVRWSDKDNRPFREICKSESDAKRFCNRLQKSGIKSTPIFEKQSTNYNFWYEPVPVLKRLLDEHHPDIDYTPCRVHNIQFRYPIQYQSGPVVCDRRIGWIKSWKPRGDVRHKFWYSGKGNKLNITVDVHPQTLIVYPDKGQFLIAKSITDTEIRTITQIHDTASRWCSDQLKFGIRFNIGDPEETGKQTTKTEYGFLINQNTPVSDVKNTLVAWGINPAEVWVDGSPLAHGHPYLEVETRSRPTALGMQEAIDAMKRVDPFIAERIKAAIPELMNPLHEKLTAIEAHIHGGTTYQYQVAQQNAFITALATQVNSLLPDLIVQVESLSSKVERLTEVRN